MFADNGPGPGVPGRRPERSDRQRPVPVAVLVRSDDGRLFQKRSGRSAQKSTIRHRKTVSTETVVHRVYIYIYYKTSRNRYETKKPSFVFSYVYLYSRPLCRTFDKRNRNVPGRVTSYDRFVTDSFVSSVER